MPLSAARGAWAIPSGGGGSRSAAVFLLEQPVVFEKALLEAAGVVAPVLAPHGTVAATAIELALVSTSSPVIVAGLDMGSRDLLSHARPNAFDWLLHAQASRMQPHASLAFHRAAKLGSIRDPLGSGVRVSPALRTYAGWLDGGLTAARGRVHRLLPSSVTLSAMTPLDGPGLRRLLRGLPFSPGGTRLRPDPGFPRGAERKRIVSALLKEWTTEVAAARELVTSVGDLGRFPRVLELAHVLAPRLLVDAMKKARQGDRAAARTSTGTTLTECFTYLSGLRERNLG